MADISFIPPAASGPGVLLQYELKKINHNLFTENNRVYFYIRKKQSNT